MDLIDAIRAGWAANDMAPKGYPVDPGPVENNALTERWGELERLRPISNGSLPGRPSHFTCGPT